MDTLINKFEIVKIIKNFIVFILFFSLISCTTNSYNYSKELSKIEECKNIEPFFSKSRTCLKQSIISSDVIYPKLVSDMENLTDLIDNRLNENKISNDMAWKLFLENLEIAVGASTLSDAEDISLKLNSFIESIK